MPFFIDEARDLAVAQIPKAGIQTFRDWLGLSFDVVKNDDPRLLAVTRRVAFIRNPQERLKSCYSMMYWTLEYYGRPHWSNPPVDSWEIFVDHILDPNTTVNGHWQPQTEHVGDVPNIYHRFENLADHWETYRPGFLPWNNRASRRPTPNYRVDDLIAMYSADIALWSGSD